MRAREGKVGKAAHYSPCVCGGQVLRGFSGSLKGFQAAFDVWKTAECFAAAFQAARLMLAAGAEKSAALAEYGFFDMAAAARADLPLAAVNGVFLLEIAAVAAAVGEVAQGAAAGGDGAGEHGFDAAGQRRAFFDA